MQGPVLEPKSGQSLSIPMNYRGPTPYPRTDLGKLTACVAVADPVHVRVRYPLK
jgi:hypothetical protein